MEKAPERPQPYDALIMAASLFGLGVFLGMIQMSSQHPFSTSMVWILVVIFDASLAFVLAFLIERRRLQREGWCEQIEAPHLELPLDDGQFDKGICG